VINISNTSRSGSADEVLSYEWTVTYRTDSSIRFTSTDANPSFTLVEEGFWDIELVVTGTYNGQTRSATALGFVQVVTSVQEPIPDFIITRVQELVDGAFIISVVDSSDQINGGPIAEWEWSISGPGGVTTFDGAGPFDGPGPYTATFTQEGTYTISMTVYGPNRATGGNVTKSATAVAGGTVTASFSLQGITELGGGEYRICLQNDSVNYDTATWQINNGTPFENNNDVVCVTVQQAGNVTILLTTTRTGQASAQDSQFVTIAQGEQPPVANFILSHTQRLPGQSITLTNTSTGNVETWLWELIFEGQVIASNSTNYHTSFVLSQAGDYIVRLTVENSGGSSQRESQTITTRYAQYQCAISGTGNVFPGQGATYNANQSNLNGRSVTTHSWSVVDSSGNVIETGDNPNINISWDVDAGTYTILYTGTLDDASTCQTQRNIVVVQPPLDCSISGNNNLYPDQQTTFTISVPSNVQAAWENISYNWTLSGDYELLNGSLTSTSITVRWPDAGSFSVTGQINANGASSPVDCRVDFQTVNVDYRGLDCRDPNGSTTPFAGQTINYSVTPNDGNSGQVRYVQGRNIRVEWSMVDTTTSQVVATGDGTSFAYQFPDVPGGKYRLTYRVFFVDDNGNDIAQGCERSRDITVRSEKVICTGFSGSFVSDGVGGNTTFSYSFNRGVTNVTVKWFINGQEVGTTSNNTNLTILNSVLRGIGTGEHTIKAQVIDATDGTVYCEGERGLVLGRLRVDFDVDKTNISPGEQICVTNTSNSVYGDLEDLPVNWTWSFDFNRNRPVVSPLTSTDFQPSNCITFNEAGSYDIRLDGVMDGTSAGNFRGQRTRTITVASNDGISVTANPNPVEGGSTINFEATLINVDESTLVWSIDGQVFNQAGTRFVSRSFPIVTQVTQYTIRVTGRGTVGQVTGEVVVTVYPPGGRLSANFYANRYGVAPGGQVCFYDQSTFEGPQIVRWTWDFGNGSTVTFTQADYQNEVCTTYTGAGLSFIPKLTVENELGLSVQATNTIRVYNDLENRSTFSTTYPGGNGVCVVAVVDNDVVVSGWDFGGTGTQFAGTLPGQVCFTYDAPGDYVISMNIGSGAVIGSVVRGVTVGGSAGQQSPYIEVQRICTGANARLVITNTGGDMPVADGIRLLVVRTSGANPTIVDRDDINLKRGETFELNLTANSPTDTADVTWSYGSQGGTFNIALSCWDQSDLSVSGQCVPNNNASFVVSNTGSTMNAETQWALYANPQGVNNGTLLQNGNVGPLASGGNDTLTFNNFDASVTRVRLVLNQRPGHPGNGTTFADVNLNCGDADLQISGQCDANGVATFTVTNVGAHMTTPANVLATAQFSTPTANPAQVQLNRNQSVNVQVTNGYGVVTLKVDGFTAEANATCPSPIVTPILECVDQINATTFVAHLGYNNTSTQVINVPVGASNGFSPAPQDRNQPTSFQTGAVNNAFTVQFEGVLTWSLLGSSLVINPSTSAPCSYDISFDKVWVDGNGNTTTPPTLPNGWQINAQSFDATGGNFASVTCTWNGGLSCDNSLEVPTGGSYSVSETAVSGWAATNLGTFGVPGNQLTCGLGGIATTCEHIVTNTLDEVLDINGYCGDTNGSFVFEASNNSTYTGAGTYTIHETGNSANVVQTGDLSDLPVTVTSSLASLTLTVSGAAVNVAPVTVDNCYKVPTVQASGQCVSNQQGVFSVSIERVDAFDVMGAATVSYEIVTNEGTTLDSGTLDFSQLPFTYTSNPLTVTSITLNITGTTGNIGIAQNGNTYTTSNCYQVPQITLGGQCLQNGEFFFRATVNTPPAGVVTYEIREANNQLLTSGPLSDLAQGIIVDSTSSRLTLTLIGNEVAGISPYSKSNCYNAPDIKVTLSCPPNSDNGTFRLQVRNNGGSLLPSQDVRLTVTANDGAITVVNDQVITLPFNQDYGDYLNVSVIVTVSGTTINETASRSNCYTHPIVKPLAECASNGEFVMTIYQHGNTQPINPNAKIFYTIRDSSGGSTSGEITYNDLRWSTPITGNYSWVEIEITGFESEGRLYSADYTTKRATNCYQVPTVNLNAVCVGGSNGEYLFTGSLSNRPAPINPAGYTYSITDAGNNVIQSGAFSDLTQQGGLNVSSRLNGLVITVTASTEDGGGTKRIPAVNCYVAPTANLNLLCVDGSDGEFSLMASTTGSFFGNDTAYLLVTAVGANGTETLFNGDFTGIVSNNYSPYYSVTAKLSLIINGVETVISEITKDECYAPPAYTLNGICANANGGYSFSVALTSGTRLSNSVPQVNIVGYNPHTDSTETLYQGDYNAIPAVLSGTYTYATLYFDAAGEGTVSPVTSEVTVNNCYIPPQVQPLGACLSGVDQNGNGTFGFSISLTSGVFLAGTPTIPYTVIDEDDNVIASGVIDHTTAFPVQLRYVGEYDSLSLLFQVAGQQSPQVVASASNCFAEPNYEADVICVPNTNGNYSVTIQNTGGAIVTSTPSYQIFLTAHGDTTEQGQGVVAMQGGTLNTTITGRYNSVRVEVYVNGQIVETAQSAATCYVEPVLDLQVICVNGSNGSFQVLLTSNGTPFVPMAGDADTVLVIDFTDVSGTVTQQTFKLNALLGNNPIFDQTFTGTYSLVSAVASSPGILVDASASNNGCYNPPAYEVLGICTNDNGGYSFVVHNVGGTPVNPAALTYVITASRNGVDETLRGNVTFGQAITVTDRYERVQIIVTAPEGNVTYLNNSNVLECYTAPIYEVSVICTGTNGEFTVTVNLDLVNGGLPVGPAPTVTINFAIVNGGGTSNDVFTLDLSNLPYTETFTGPYASVSVDVSSPDVAIKSANANNCYQLPDYVPTLVCEPNSNGTFIYGFTNQGGSPVLPGSTPLWRLEDHQGNVIDNGSDDAPFSLSITGTYSELTFYVESGAAFFGARPAQYVSATNDTCYVPPVYEPDAYCDQLNGQFTFTVTNTGGTPLLALPDYIITDENGTIIETGTVNVLPFSITVRGAYQSVKFTLNSVEGTVTRDTTVLDNCYQEPVYVPELICYGQDGFFFIQINNVGGDPLPNAVMPTYRLESPFGDLLLSGTVDVLPYTTSFVGPYESAKLLTTLQDGVTVVESTATGCYGTDDIPTPTPPSTPPPPSDDPELVCGETMGFTPDGFPIINLDASMCVVDNERPLVDWQPLEIGEAICPDWLLYHTNQTGDWEVFRLGLTEELVSQIVNGDPNISQGPDSTDLAPSRAPDGTWVAFASNRTGNWEIFIANVLDPANTVIQITDNDSAIDLDPVWSPDGRYIAYESTVDGQWEIRLVDLMTGEKYRLTDNPANDINPFWSADGTKLLFQSDRYISESGERLWQVYELDLSNGFSNPTVTYVEGQPEGDNHDPQYSDDGTVIAFRSYVDDSAGRESAIYIIVNGEDAIRVSDLGGLATNHAISPNSQLIAYQSNVENGINDIYVYEIATGLTRLITDNTEDYAGIQDFAPTWYCNSTTLIFVSNVALVEGGVNANNIYQTEALPMDAPALEVDNEASPLTATEDNDRDPQNSPSEENASRAGNTPFR
jgi:Tol biopolymer transport system component